MSLQADFFNLIACGKKTIKIRLNDEKRMKVKSGEEDFTGRLKILLQAVKMNYKEREINFIYRGVSLKDENIC